jgi:hypothetical protein
MRRFQKFVSAVLLPVVTLLKFLNRGSRHVDSVLDIISLNAKADSASFVQANLSGAQLFATREALWDYALENLRFSGLHIELGVWSGNSIRYFALRAPNQTIYGFDSFRGLADDWLGAGLQRGAFDLKGNLPKVPVNVTLVPGWFEETLPTFNSQQNDPIAFIHLDADTYTSTKLALEALASKIIAGTILVFDEYHGYPNWREGEFKAWDEFVGDHDIEFSYLAFSEQQVAIEIVQQRAQNS